MSMNIFRLAGDMSHVFSIIVLLLRLRVAKNAQGETRGAVYGLAFLNACGEKSLRFVRPSEKEVHLKGSLLSMTVIF